MTSETMETTPGGSGDRKVAEATAIATRLIVNIATVIEGKDDQIRLVLAALACRGHVLLEDVPGTAKTVLARSLAGSIEGATVSRIQCTPDLQPTDVTGSRSGTRTRGTSSSGPVRSSQTCSSSTR